MRPAPVSAAGPPYLSTLTIRIHTILQKSLTSNFILLSLGPLSPTPSCDYASLPYITIPDYIPAGLPAHILSVTHTLSTLTSHTSLNSLSSPCRSSLRIPPPRPAPPPPLPPNSTPTSHFLHSHLTPSPATSIPPKVATHIPPGTSRVSKKRSQGLKEPISVSTTRHPLLPHHRCTRVFPNKAPWFPTQPTLSCLDPGPGLPSARPGPAHDQPSPRTGLA